MIITLMKGADAPGLQLNLEDASTDLEQARRDIIDFIIAGITPRVTTPDS